MTLETWIRYVELTRPYQWKTEPGFEIQDYQEWNWGNPQIHSHSVVIEFTGSTVKCCVFNYDEQRWLTICEDLEAIITFEEIYNLPPLHERLGLEVLLED